MSVALVSLEVRVLLAALIAAGVDDLRCLLSQISSSIWSRVGGRFVCLLCPYSKRTSTWAERDRDLRIYLGGRR